MAIVLAGIFARRRAKLVSRIEADQTVQNAAMTHISRFQKGALIMKVVGLAAALLLLGGAAYGQTAPGGAAGHFQARLRGIAVLPDPSADIAVSGIHIGGTTSVSDSFEPEADLTYFITDHLAVEAIAAVTKHTVRNSVAGTVSSVWLLPPTVTAQYHFDPSGSIRPYVGAGVNYTVFYDPHSALANIGFKNSFGWALQAGADIPVGDSPYLLNLDVKKVFLGTHIRAAAGAVQASARLNPWLIGAGVGVRF
ncbi:MAG TPA: OmpW family outer membrane protein [Rhizomicrobium sp.]|nr:OmpW family outer membrane protein [Rhizomicrobium sp.]